MTTIRRNPFGPSGAAVYRFATILIAVLSIASFASAQTFTVLHNFTGGSDGGSPLAGVTLDQAGNLYGTTYLGGTRNDNCAGPPGCGEVYRLQRRNGSWIFSSLYRFNGDPNDGALPQARVVFGPDGALYGTTHAGGLYLAGTVFKLTPPANICPTVSCPWTKTQLYQFTRNVNNGILDGYQPSAGDVIFDAAGNLYGTTLYGGDGQDCDDRPCGTVYELSPSSGGWTEKILYGFQGWNDGAFPNGVLFDRAGNLVGTSAAAGEYGEGGGTIFELRPTGGGWTESTCYTFLGGPGGWQPMAGFVAAPNGTLFGSTSLSGSGGGGTVFQFSPAGGSLQLTTLYSFIFPPTGFSGPTSALTMDAQGNLYGTTYADGQFGSGAVFKLTPSVTGWTYTSLHDFTGGSGGANPFSNVVMDANGNLYGTASGGGTGSDCPNGCGLVWEITP